jgi:hypothetical protein
MTNDLDVSKRFDLSRELIYSSKSYISANPLTRLFISIPRRRERRKKLNNVMDDHQNTPSPPSTISIII